MVPGSPAEHGGARPTHEPDAGPAPAQEGTAADEAAAFDARVAAWEVELADDAARFAWALAADQAELAAMVAEDPALAVALGWAPDPNADPWEVDGGPARSAGRGSAADPREGSVPLEQRSDHALTVRIAELERQVAEAQAEQARAMVVLARRSVFRRADTVASPAATTVTTRRRLDTIEERCARAAYELSVALTIAPTTAARRLGVALDLVEHLPATLAALGAGRLSWQRASIIATETQVLPPVARAAVEHRALTEADSLTPGQLTAKVRRWVLAADPAAAEERHERARSERQFRLTPLPDGMAMLRAVLAADAAATIGTAVEAVATSLAAADAQDAAEGAPVVDGSAPAASQRRTADQRRADALTIICADVLSAGHTGCGSSTCGDACTAALDAAAVRGSSAARSQPGAGALTNGRRAAPSDEPLAGRDTDTSDYDLTAVPTPGERQPAVASALPPTPSGGSRPPHPPPPMTPAGTSGPRGGGAGRDGRSGGPPGRRSRTRLARWHGHRPHVQVTVAMTTLLGLDELPGELEGYGPIPAHVARRIAADGNWRRLLTDPVDGRLLDYGRRHRVAPRDLADHVIARDGTDRFPTSRVPARRCDLDHAVTWEDLGATSEHNLNAVSPRAHQVRHDTGWTVGREPDGSLRWTTATGHTAGTPVNQVGTSHADRALAGIGAAGGSWAGPDDDVPPY